VSGMLAPDNTTLPNWFVARWTLTLTLPMVLASAGQVGIATSGVLTVEEAVVVLLFVAWLLIAFLQFRLLRHHLRRPWLWFAATLAGGVVGNLAGSFVILPVQSAIEAIVDGEAVSALTHQIFLYLPFVLQALVSAAILALAQIACFDETMGERVPWYCASLGAAILGASLSALAVHYSIQGMEATGFYESAPPMLQALILVQMATVANFALYGALTGICMKKLLARRAGLHRHDLLGQFE
jgi:hypothetical protein